MTLPLHLFSDNDDDDDDEDLHTNKYTKWYAFINFPQQIY